MSFKKGDKSKYNKAHLEPNMNESKDKKKVKEKICDNRTKSMSILTGGREKNEVARLGCLE